MLHSLKSMLYKRSLHIKICFYKKGTCHMYIRGYFYEKPIGTSKTGNLVFLCTPTSTLDDPKYSISTSHGPLFSRRVDPYKLMFFMVRGSLHNMKPLHKKWRSSFLKML